MKFPVLALALGLVSIHANASEKLICADRSKDSYSVDITEASKLAQGLTLSVALNFKNFRSYPEKVDTLVCDKPVGNGMTAEHQPLIRCQSARYELLVDTTGDGSLKADLFDNRSGNLAQGDIPCMVTISP